MIKKELKDIQRVIQCHVNEGWEIKKHWVDEYNNLIRRIEASGPEDCPTCHSYEKAIKKRIYIASRISEEEYRGRCPDTWHDEPDAPTHDSRLPETHTDTPMPPVKPPKDYQPTHKERMTKWWRLDDGVWCRVSGYHNKYGYYMPWNKYVPASYFTNRESADTPPEA